MNFKLREFAKNELKEYEVIRQGEYNIDNVDSGEESYFFPMVIYKKALRVLTPNDDGIRVFNQLNGKIEKQYNLKLDDVIVVENLRYRVTEILPRIYADFYEFTLEVERNGQ